MNPALDLLQPYPFQKLRELFAGITPNPEQTPINLSIGEPKHPTPDCIRQALVDGLAGLAQYPATQGSDELRATCADWLAARYAIPRPNPATEILPVCGSREALFSFTQIAFKPLASGEKPVALLPNPFYQIYEGATLLAGGEPVYLNCEPERRFQPDWSEVSEAIWQRTQLVFVCSPGNPTGAVMTLADWEALFSLSDRYGFVIASDECYSEIWQQEPPLGGLQAAVQLGRTDFRRLVCFTSLSKRSNAPGLRSGFVAGDAAYLKAFLLYRTYHGAAMSPTVQKASVAAWQDEQHVENNRAAYREKFQAVTPIVAEVLETAFPEAGFYLWARVPSGDDVAFARDLFAQEHVTVLPGSFLARSNAAGANPGQGFIRIALVAPLAECVEAAERIRRFVQTAL